MEESIRAIEALQSVQKSMRHVEIPHWPDGKADQTAYDVKMLCIEVVQAQLARELKKP